MMQISIIIPCYNIVGKIDKLIKSLDNQTNSNFNVFFIDDYSNDNSYKYLVDKLKDVNFAYKIMQNPENLGPGITRNNGIEYSNGDYITFVDADDNIKKDFVEKILVNLNGKDIDLLIFDFNMHLKNKVVKWRGIDYTDYGTVNKETVMYYGNSTTFCKVYKKSIIDDFNIRYGSGKRGEDTNFAFKNFYHSNKILYINESIYDYVRFDDSLMAEISPDENINIKNYLEMKSYIPNDELYLLERYFLKNFMFSAVVSMLELKKTRKEIKNFIEYWSESYPKWGSMISNYEFSRTEKHILKNINKKRVLYLKLLWKVYNIIN